VIANRRSYTFPGWPSLSMEKPASNGACPFCVARQASLAALRKVAECLASLLVFSEPVTGCFAQQCGFGGEHRGMVFAVRGTDTGLTADKRNIAIIRRVLMRILARRSLIPICRLNAALVSRNLALRDAWFRPRQTTRRENRHNIETHGYAWTSTSHLSGPCSIRG
jgi:hypothetical protein